MTCRHSLSEVNVSILRPCVYVKRISTRLELLDTAPDLAIEDLGTSKCVAYLSIYTVTFAVEKLIGREIVKRAADRRPSRCHTRTARLPPPLGRENARRAPHHIDSLGEGVLSIPLPPLFGPCRTSRPTSFKARTARRTLISPPLPQREYHALKAESGTAYKPSPNGNTSFPE